MVIILYFFDFRYSLLDRSCLLFADTLARIAASPRQLPVGALTALIGVPLFLILMRRERRITS